MKGRQETTGEPSAAALLDLEAASKALADFEAPTSNGGAIDFTDWPPETQREYRRLQTQLDLAQDTVIEQRNASSVLMPVPSGS